MDFVFVVFWPQCASRPLSPSPRLVFNAAHLCQLFGPLSGLTYVSTDMPGELYEKIISEAVRIVQKWWRDIGPQRLLRNACPSNPQGQPRGRAGVDHLDVPPARWSF